MQKYILNHCSLKNVHRVINTRQSVYFHKQHAVLVIFVLDSTFIPVFPAVANCTRLQIIVKEQEGSKVKLYVFTPQPLPGLVIHIPNLALKIVLVESGRLHTSFFLKNDTYNRMRQRPTSWIAEFLSAQRLIKVCVVRFDIPIQLPNLLILEQR